MGQLRLLAWQPTWGCNRFTLAHDPGPHDQMYVAACQWLCVLCSHLHLHQYVALLRGLWVLWGRMHVSNGLYSIAKDAYPQTYRQTASPW